MSDKAVISDNYLSVDECLALLPVRVSEREFRKQVRVLGLCYKRGHQIALDRRQLDTYIETLKCPTSNSSNAEKSITSTGRSKSPAKRLGSEFEKARAMLD
jgi:hypothetical protein